MAEQQSDVDRSRRALAALDQETRRLRVALVLATSTGGVGRHVRALANGLVEAGHRVEVLGPAATNAKFAFDTPDSRLTFRPVGIAAGFRPWLDFRAVVRLRRLTRDADVVHAHGLRAAAVTATALSRSPFRSLGFRRRGLRRRAFGRRGIRRPIFVVTFHNAVLGNGFRHRVLRFVMCRAAGAADTTLVVSADLAAELAASGVASDKALVAAVLPPPSRDAGTVRSALGIGVSDRMVVAVGRLHPQKGFDVLVRASEMLRDRAPDVFVVVAGEGPARPMLEGLIAAGESLVRLLGDRHDVTDLVHAADVVVMPSRWEGWPLTAAEALGAGRPLVVTRVGGLPELVGDAALLVEPEDPLALADGLTRVLTDPKLAAELSARAISRAAELPSDDDVTAQILASYQRIPDSVRDPAR